MWVEGSHYAGLAHRIVRKMPYPGDSKSKEYVATCTRQFCVATANPCDKHLREQEAYCFLVLEGHSPRLSGPLWLAYLGMQGGVGSGGAAGGRRI